MTSFELLFRSALTGVIATTIYPVGFPEQAPLLNLDHSRQTFKIRKLELLGGLEIHLREDPPRLEQGIFYV